MGLEDYYSVTPSKVQTNAQQTNTKQTDKQDTMEQTTTKQIIEKYGAIVRRAKLQTNGKFAHGQTFVETSNAYIEDINFHFSQETLSYVTKFLRNNLPAKLQKLMPEVSEECVSSSHSTISTNTLFVSAHTQTIGRKVGLNILFNPRQSKTIFFFDAEKDAELYSLLPQTCELATIAQKFLFLEKNPQVLANLLLFVLIDNNPIFFNLSYFVPQNNVQKDTPSLLQKGQLHTTGGAKPKLVFVSNSLEEERKRKAIEAADRRYFFQLAKDIANGKKDYSDPIVQTFSNEEKQLLKKAVLRELKHQELKLREKMQTLKMRAGKKRAGKK